MHLLHIHVTNILYSMHGSLLLRYTYVDMYIPIGYLTETKLPSQVTMIRLWKNFAGDMATS